MQYSQPTLSSKLLYRVKKNRLVHKHIILRIQPATVIEINSWKAGVTLIIELKTKNWNILLSTLHALPILFILDVYIDFISYK